MLTFPNVTPQVFALVLDELRKSATVAQWIGSEVPKYRIEGAGVTVDAIQCTNGGLQINILSKPWYVPESVIESKIRDAITLAQQVVAHG